MSVAYVVMCLYARAEESNAEDAMKPKESKEVRWQEPGEISEQDTCSFGLYLDISSAGSRVFVVVICQLS